MTEALHVTVGSAPEPGFLRPAIEAALAGRPWPPGVEAQIAAAVVVAVQGSSAGASPGSAAGTRPAGLGAHAPVIRTASPEAEGDEGR